MQLEINNLKVNYLEKGPQTKTSVVLLHGWGASISAFNPIIDNLSKKFKVYAIDFPGFGLSDKPDKSYHVEDYSKIVLEFINKMNLKDVILIGHSFGGRVIIKLVGKLGFSPKKIILVDSAGIRPKKSLKVKIRERIYKCIKKVARIILGKAKADKIINKYKNKLGSEDYKNADETMKEVFKNVINEDLTDYLPNIKAPTLLVWGDKDTETPISDAKIMESLIPDSGIVTIRGAGHFSYLDNTTFFLTVVNNFLEGCE